MNGHGSHVDEHRPHVNWKLFLEARCPMGMNKSRITHYFQFVQH